MYYFDVYAITGMTFEVEAENVFDYEDHIAFEVGEKVIAGFVKANIIGWRKLGYSEQPESAEEHFAVASGAG